MIGSENDAPSQVEDGSQVPTVRPDSAAVDELHQRLVSAIASLETGDQWQAWLKLAHRLHRYSFNNLVLIWSQRPEATQVASYSTWKSADRQVLRGEKAIKIMAPITRRAAAPDSTATLEPPTEPSADARRRIVGFRQVSVFDVSQTDGSPLPEAAAPQLLTGHAPDGLWDLLAEQVNQHGYRLFRGSRADLLGANGLTRPDSREVWVRSDVDDAQACKTLAHELAHVVLHTGGDQAPANLSCTGVREVEAESVAHLVLGAKGLTTDSYSFPYVAAWAQPLAIERRVTLADVVTSTGSRVVTTARQLIDATQLLDSEGAADPLTVRISKSSRRSAQLNEMVEGSSELAELEVLRGVLADSQDYFSRMMDGSWVPSYLKIRGLDSAMTTHGLGYAPRQWTTLTDHLRCLGYVDAHIEAAGMATRTQNGHLIDRFRDRMTIPIHDHGGRLVGFTARENPDHKSALTPKYLNSPTTALFHKSEVLYGLARHGERLAAGHRAVLCEGPLDAIAVDITNSTLGVRIVGLAVAGTAFTRDHADALLAVVGEHRMCLAFDADEAGRRATAKAFRLLTEHQPLDITVAEFDPGTDPAATLEESTARLATLFQNPDSAAWAVASHEIAAANVSGNVFKEMLAFRELAELRHRLPEHERTRYLERLGNELHIDPVDAEYELARGHPDLLKDRVIDHCRRLDGGADQAPLAESVSTLIEPITHRARSHD